MQIRLFVVSALLAGCVSEHVTESRMMLASAREPSCELQLVQADMTGIAFGQTWDLLGYVMISNPGVQDPTAAPNRATVRARACAMGGTAIAIAMNVTSAGGGALSYMVLRPKTVPAATTF